MKNFNKGIMEKLDFIKMKFSKSSSKFAGLI